MTTHPRSAIIGANLRPGITPGGFTKLVTGGSRAGRKLPRGREISTDAIRAAANAALNKRGISQQAFREM